MQAPHLYRLKNFSSMKIVLYDNLKLAKEAKIFKIVK
jgi:hypothetical protein